eukprot:g2890.t1
MAGTDSAFDVVVHALRGAATTFGAVCTATALVAAATSANRRQAIRAALLGAHKNKAARSMACFVLVYRTLDPAGAGDRDGPSRGGGDSSEPHVPESVGAATSCVRRRSAPPHRRRRARRARAAFWAAAAAFTLTDERERTPLIAHAIVRAIATLWGAIRDGECRCGWRVGGDSEPGADGGAGAGAGAGGSVGMDASAGASVRAAMLRYEGAVQQLVLCAAGARLTYAWLFEPHTFQRAHRVALDHYSSVPRAQLAALRSALMRGRGRLCQLPATATSTGARGAYESYDAYCRIVVGTGARPWAARAARPIAQLVASGNGRSACDAVAALPAGAVVEGTDTRFLRDAVAFAALHRTPALLLRAARVFAPIQGTALVVGALRRGARHAMKVQGRDSHEARSRLREQKRKQERKQERGHDDDCDNAQARVRGGTAVATASIAAALRRAVASFVRSCCFLAAFYQLPMLAAALYPTAALLPLPHGQHNRRRLSHAISVGGVCGAMGMLLERSGRKSIIVSLCTCYAGISMGRELADAHGWPRRGQYRGRTPLDVLIFSACVAVLLRYQEHQPALLVRWLQGGVC